MVSPSIRLGTRYLAGYTATDDFPTTPGALRSPGGTDAFVVKVSPAGALVYSAQIGGRNIESAYGIAVDPDGNAYVAGVAYSNDFPVTPGSYAGKVAGHDAFLSKLDPSGSSLVYSLRIGGSNDDEAVAVSLDSSGNAYIFGSTGSPDFPLTSGAVQPCRPPYHPSFLAKFDASGRNLLYSTFFGGNGGEDPKSVAADTQGGVWIAGGTRSSDLPITSPAPDLRWGRAAFISRIDLGANIAPAISCIASSATLISGPLAPGEIVAVFGSGIGPENPEGLRLDEKGKVATTLAGARLWFDDVPAPLLYVQADQVNAVVPFAMHGKTSVQVSMEYQGKRSSPVTVPVAAAAPGVFTTTMTGGGQAAVLNEDGTVNSPSNPAAEGSVIAIYATGAGQTIPPGVDGQVNAVPYPKPLLPVRVRMNGIEAEVQYAGAAPGYVAGALQVNAKVPVDPIRGSNPMMGVQLVVGDDHSYSPWGGGVSVK